MVDFSFRKKNSNFFIKNSEIKNNNADENYEKSDMKNLLNFRVTVIIIEIMSSTSLTLRLIKIII